MEKLDEKKFPRIVRNEYLERLRTLRHKKLIKIVTGIRRCGKSTILEMFRDELLSEGIKKEQIVFINFEDFESKSLRNPDLLYSFIKERLTPEINYIFLDEIQRVENFPDVVDGLYIKKNVDLYLTGSNSSLLSNEIATLIGGRYVEIKMLPLSFKEFAQATNQAANLYSAYRQYIQTSSFPYVTELLESPQEINSYLEGIYNTILVKDIIDRKRISDTLVLKSVTQFLFDNIGLELSSKKIADTLTSSSRKSDSKTIEKYVSALEESFIVYRANRYNIKGKEYLKSLEKYYAADVGLRNFMLGKKAMDVGHILENVVYLELLRRGYSVYVGKIDAFEVDFVAQNQNGNTYIQVAASVRDYSTLERELKPLKMIKDNYSKMILTLDDDPEADYDGIIRKNALEWLME
ncbi:ATP-binding protein [Treponema parvum]|uniref:ATP-binding protein n=1 Tax=Treponema parvum TaxID=138851 RepID=A0A975F2L9_9SPIR|nr:ATP-binding protein [Treponema parvum]QTQ13490.1 ATP-binding protein [Treponema parvum]